MNLKTRANFVDLINEKKYRIGAEIGVRSGAYSKYLVENSFMISFASTMKMIKHTKKNGKQSHREG